jgi:hypothetical protein
VSYRPSARGGIGVVVMIPRQLVTEEPRLSPILPARRGELVAASVGATTPVASVVDVDEPPADADQPFELARREPGRTLAQVTERARATEPPKARTDPSAAFSAFQRSASTSTTDAAPAEQ